MRIKRFNNRKPWYLRSRLRWNRRRSIRKRREEDQQKAEKAVESATKQQKEAQLGTRLEREGVAALEQFKFEQTKGLLLAMRSVYPLIPFEKEGRSIEAYPAASPLLATQTGLDRMQETVLKGHQGIVYSVSYSPDGETLATSGADGTARIWDTSGRQIAQYDGQGYVNSNWTTIATINPSPADSNNQIVTLRPLTVSPTALLDRACQKLKYYLLQSPELKDDRTMCGFEK